MAFALGSCTSKRNTASIANTAVSSSFLAPSEEADIQIPSDIATTINQTTEEGCTAIDSGSFENSESFSPELIIEVSKYFDHCKDLVQDLGMQQGQPLMPYGKDHYLDEMYLADGFFLDYFILDHGLQFTMWCDTPGIVVLYGNDVGCDSNTFVNSLEENGWILAVDENGQPYDENNYFLGTVLDGVRFCVEMSINSDNTVSMWYLNNWPQGDYEEFYSQFE